MHKVHLTNIAELLALEVCIWSQGELWVGIRVRESLGLREKLRLRGSEGEAEESWG